MIYRYIYKITCTAGSFKDYFYYGQHTTKKLNDGYKGSGKLLRSYYKKYPNDYIKEIISFHNSQEELNKAEYDIIHKYLNDSMCLNISEGGLCGGHPQTEKTKQQISSKLKGVSKPGHTSWLKGKKNPYSEERLKQISEQHKGKHHSEETRRKISESQKGRKAWNEGLPAWNKGKKMKPHSEETKKKISEGVKRAKSHQCN